MELTPIAERQPVEGQHMLFHMLFIDGLTARELKPSSLWPMRAIWRCRCRSSIFKLLSTACELNTLFTYLATYEIRCPAKSSVVADDLRVYRRPLGQRWRRRIGPRK